MTSCGSFAIRFRIHFWCLNWNERVSCFVWSERPRCSLLCLFACLVNYTLSSFCGRSSMLSLLVSLEAMRPCHYVDICTLLHFRFLLACLSGISECRLRKKNVLCRSISCVDRFLFILLCVITIIVSWK